MVSEVDVIVNAAAESHVEKSIEEGASEFVTTNVEGTQILLDAIRRTPVERFILISSSEVYGTAETDPMDERHPLEPRSPYAATKAGGDRLAYSSSSPTACRSWRAAVRQLRPPAPRRSCRASLRRLRRRSADDPR
jgi:dTDP-D-glucose 4,6-dehydratase